MNAMEQNDVTMNAGEAQKGEKSLLMQNYENLRAVIGKDMKDYFREDGSSITIYGSYAEAVFRMNGQYMAEDVAGELSDQLGVNILYAATRHYGKFVEVVAYSQPVIDKMYVIMLSSCQHGIVEEMTVVLFESYEPMFELLSRKLAEVGRKNTEIMEKETKETLHSHFFK